MARSDPEEAVTFDPIPSLQPFELQPWPEPPVQKIDREALLEEIRQAMKMTITISFESNVKVADDSIPRRVIDEDMGLGDLAFLPRMPPGPIFAIEYTDRAGRQTRRIIALNKVIDGLIYAFCFGRCDKRHFFVDRVNEFFDPLTGEPFADLAEAIAAGQRIRKELMVCRRRPKV